MSVLWGALGGGLMYAVLHMMGAGITPKRSIFFGDISKWPNFVKGFWLLDLLEICCAFYVLMYIMMHVVLSSGHPGPGSLSKVRFGLGLIVGFGCLGSVFMTGMSGWYTGLEGFVLFGFGLLAAFAAILGLVILVASVGLFIAEQFKRVWPSLRQMSVVKPLVRVGHYLNADDVQSDEPG